ncbi:DUF2019 domain-containing protein [Nitratireductor sp. ZSWI3]|uniref:DUF2019 domain-containing protein n=1 Tax=Nitratireductor sp. ZSWI3 TaxID=2966359 RepID=UPI002150169B|nr:DUF2019 domain-containing protein [Nitratireductor sp. ZSWI3]MCR4266097.1 DUF2019 domain-containing protein [Nitratireductor sp. ZSWI3]
MKPRDVRKLQTERLVERFIEIGMEQDHALLGNQVSRFNRLFGEKQRILRALQEKPGDQRRVLFALYDHPNMQVRLNAARATRDLDDQHARALMEKIAASGHNPQAGDAGMGLWIMDGGLTSDD